MGKPCCLNEDFFSHFKFITNFFCFLERYLFFNESCESNVFDAKEGFEQLAVREGGLQCERSGITAAWCPQELLCLGGRGELAAWAAHSPSAPGRQGGRQGFHLIIATPRYPGQLCETDEMSTSELPAAFLHCCCEMKGRSHVILPWNKSCPALARHQARHIISVSPHSHPGMSRVTAYIDQRPAPYSCR